MSLDVNTPAHTLDLDSPAFADLLAELSEAFAASAAEHDRHASFPPPACNACASMACWP
jgi:hypothetical protein